MSNEEREIPRPQFSFSDETLESAGRYQLFLEKAFSGLKLNFSKVTSVIDLYCGNGGLTLGSVLVFNNAIIHPIDYHDVLVPDAMNHTRVQFHKGWVTDVLADKTVPKAEIVLMSFASRHHGFDQTNIHLLKAHVGKYLLTVGDNGDIEQASWFKNAFKIEKYGDFIDPTIWKTK